VKARDLLKTARKLVPDRGKPRQSDLRRATSTTYYALFHALARCCADCLIGTSPARRSNKAWRQAYRALDHGFAKNACKNGKIRDFPNDIQDFADQFVAMQAKRHDADYDPDMRITKSVVLNDVNTTANAIARFENTPVLDRIAFAALVLLKERG
jgi:hypothetical protein